MSNKIENLDGFKEKVLNLGKKLLKGAATIAMVSSLALTMGMGQAMASDSMPSVKYEGSSIINPTEQQVQDAHNKYDAYKNKDSENGGYTTISGNKSKISLDEYKEKIRIEREEMKLKKEKELRDYKTNNTVESKSNYEASKSGLSKEMDDYMNKASSSFDEYKNKQNSSNSKKFK